MIYFNAQTAISYSLLPIQVPCRQPVSRCICHTQKRLEDLKAEKQLGFPLFLFSHGPEAVTGSSKLTPKGEEFLKRYVKMERPEKEENGCLNFISGERSIKTE